MYYIYMKQLSKNYACGVPKPVNILGPSLVAFTTIQYISSFIGIRFFYYRLYFLLVHYNSILFCHKTKFSTSSLFENYTVY